MTRTPMTSELPMDTNQKVLRLVKEVRKPWSGLSLTSRVEATERRFLTGTRLVDGALSLLVLCAVYALKRFYSEASAAELWWVLEPTARLVELFTPLTFTSEPQGQVCTGAALTITAGCAGMNYLAVCLSSLVLGGAIRLRSAWVKLAWTLFCLPAAYGVTIFANALRIAGAWLWRGYSGHTEHLVVGVVVYLSVLLVVFQTMVLALGRSRWTA